MDHTNRVVTQLSESFINPRPGLQGSNPKYWYLTPWDLAMLSVQYIQKGLLYTKPPQMDMDAFLGQLKDSLSVVLAHFYPLAGQLETLKQDDPHRYLVYVNCEKGRGARFIHAKVDLRVMDVMEAVYVPLIVQMFFDHDRCINHEGHDLSLISIQVTELIDGIFIGCSINHSIADGTSYWHFFNTWSEIFQAQAKGLLDATISRPPLLTRWFPDSHGPKINLPFNHPDEFLTRQSPPDLLERFFHFSSNSMLKLKAKANAEANTSKISSFQALSALIWRVITRARSFPPDQPVGCRLAANVRSRLNPPLSSNYFGNSIFPVRGEATSGELLTQTLGWAAMILHEAVVAYTDKNAREFLEKWLKAPQVYQLDRLFDPYSIMMGSSPRFDMYGNEFGLGKALGLRSGYAHKFDGKVSSYPGYECDGSIDLEICLSPENMKAFECDEELLDAMSYK